MSLLKFAASRFLLREQRLKQKENWQSVCIWVSNGAMMLTFLNPTSVLSALPSLIFLIWWGQELWLIAKKRNWREIIEWPSICTNFNYFRTNALQFTKVNYNLLYFKSMSVWNLDLLWENSDFYGINYGTIKKDMVLYYNIQFTKGKKPW